jgi:RimJ/RimL family protein N-acetyltransferase
VIGEPLSPEILARRAELPRKPAPVTLEGPTVRLRPLDVAGDLDALFALATTGDDLDAKIWRYMSGGPFDTRAALAKWLGEQDDLADGRPFVVERGGAPIGVASWIANSPSNLKAELGYIWYGLAAQRTGANTEATYLWLRHCFALGYRRLEWKCHSHNERSRRAALGLGFRFEGIQEAHMIVKGRNRDTAWFRILDHEWPEVRARLEQKLRPSTPA